jgi:hypothetical protein
VEIFLLFIIISIVRILGFYRVPPIIGRYLNITSDIRRKATEELGKTFFISPGKNNNTYPVY